MSKIAFLNQSMGPGGAEKMLAFVIRSVAPQYDEVFLMQFTDSKSAYELPANIKPICLGGDLPNNGIIRKFKQFCLRVYKIHHILTNNAIDVICTFGFYYTFMAVLSAKGSKTKVIASERRSPEDDGFIWGNISKWSYKRCSKLVFQLEKASEYYYNIPPEKKIVIPNPYITKESSLQYRHEYTNKEIVMAAARIEDVKGFDIGIKAMKIVAKKHPDYKMIVYGEGDFNGKYGILIKELGIENNVEYKGYSKNVIKDILKSEIFLLPSRVEGIPNMLLEAMGVGMPCVATDCRPGGARFLIGDNEYGVLVANEDSLGVANAISLLIDNKSFLLGMSQKAIKVRERFSEERIAKEWVECFKNVVD